MMHMIIKKVAIIRKLSDIPKSKYIYIHKSIPNHIQRYKISMHKSKAHKNDNKKMITINIIIIIAPSIQFNKSQKQCKTRPQI